MYIIKHMPAQGAVFVFFPSCVFAIFHTNSMLEVATTHFLMCQQRLQIQHQNM